MKIHMWEKHVQADIKALCRERDQYKGIAEMEARCAEFWHSEASELKQDIERYEQGYVRDSAGNWVRNDLAVRCEVLESANKELEKKLLDVQKFSHEQARQEFNLRIEAEHKVVQARTLIAAMLEQNAKGLYNQELQKDAEDWVERNRRKD